MPSGVYIRTEEIKRKISESHKEKTIFRRNKTKNKTISN